MDVKIKAVPERKRNAANVVRYRSVLILLYSRSSVARNMLTPTAIYSAVDGGNDRGSEGESQCQELKEREGAVRHGGRGAGLVFVIMLAVNDGCQEVMNASGFEQGH